MKTTKTMNIPVSLRKSQRIWFCSPVFVVFLVGCSSLPGVPPVTPQSAQSSSTQKRASESARYRSLEESVAKLDAKTLRAYIDALSKPQSSIQVHQRAPWIAVTASDLVGNHPAWLLANRLENGGVFPLEARDLNISPRSANASGATIRSFDAESNAVKQVIAGQKLRSGSTPTGLASEQQKALESFNRAWGERQLEIRQSEERLRERELNDNIREQTRIEIRAIMLQGVSPDVALELSNLRLQLLRNLAVAPSQRELARRRIAEIEANLQRIWREQNLLQEKLISDSLEASPQKLRREGQEKIRATMRALAIKDSLERQMVFNDLEKLIGSDFNRAKNLSLSLFLPPATLPDEIRANFFEQRTSSGSSWLGVSAKSQNSIAQQNPSQKLAEVGPIPSSEINRLRQIALRDAAVWAQAANRLNSPSESKIERKSD